MPVVAIWAHEDPVLVYLTIEGETIVTTPEHPFYTAKGEWVPVADLQPGVEIRAAAWRSGTVEKVGFSLRPRSPLNPHPFHLSTVVAAASLLWQHHRHIIKKKMQLPFRPLPGEKGNITGLQRISRSS